MPTIGEMMPSKYFSKEDVKSPRLLTIKSFEQVNLAKENERPKLRWAMYFAEEDRPMVMNPTNLTAAAAALGSENTDDWIGRQIVAFFDPTVMYQGKPVGGVRLRAARQSTVPVPPVQQTTPDLNDDIPF